MTTINPQRPVVTGARILLCSEQPQPLYELLAAADEPSLEINTAEIDTADSGTTAMERLAARNFDVCLVDASWDNAVVTELAERIRTTYRATQLVRFSDTAEEPVATSGDPAEIVPLLAAPPIVRRLLRSALQKARLQAENHSLKRQLQVRILSEIIGQSEAANQLRTDIRRAADEDGTVLIQGEPGTGSQQVGRVIHLAGRRASRPFLVLDCRVHSAESLERELFGEGSGPSETGGIEEAGRLASGAGGTLLLKHIETLPQAAQKKLAGILSRKSFPCPVTGKMRPLDVRVMASTHVDLTIEAQEGRFPTGLYELLTACSIEIPPLRARLQDIGLLTEQILNHLAVVEGKPVKRLTVESLKTLRAHKWPGNLRELENVVERACSLDETPVLTAEAIAPWIASALPDEPEESAGLSLREMERKLIETTFTRCQGNREQTARLLQIGIRTLSGKLREYGYPPRGGPGSNRRLTKAA